MVNFISDLKFNNFSINTCCKFQRFFPLFVDLNKFQVLFMKLKFVADLKFNNFSRAIVHVSKLSPAAADICQ